MASLFAGSLRFVCDSVTRQKFTGPQGWSQIHKSQSLLVAQPVNLTHMNATVTALAYNCTCSDIGQLHHSLLRAWQQDFALQRHQSWPCTLFRMAHAMTATLL